MSNYREGRSGVGLNVPSTKLNFEDRFLRLISMVGGADEAAAICDAGRSTLYSWAKSDGKVPLNAALKLAQAAGVSLDWVATGYDRRPDLASAPQEDEDLIKVPRLGVTAAAGVGIRNENAEVEDYIYLTRAQLRAFGVPPDAVHFISVRGDSMEPTISDGANVLIDASRRRFRGDGVYALSIDGDVRLKRLTKTTDGSFLAISDNERYPPERLSRADLDGLQIEGRVVSTERRL